MGPTSHWNVSEIPSFRPASKPPLPDGHSHCKPQENPFRLCPDFQFGKQMATIARLSTRPLISFLLFIPFSWSNIVLWLQAQKELELEFQFFHFFPVLQTWTPHLGLSLLTLCGKDNNCTCNLVFLCRWILLFCFIWFYLGGVVVLGIKPSSLCGLGKHFTPAPHLQPR